jgi:CHAD domain-containing protein
MRIDGAGELARISRQSAWEFSHHACVAMQTTPIIATTSTRRAESAGADRPEKWLAGCGPEDRTSDVALVTLQTRLHAVLHYLPLAAANADADIERVHALRVWTRRAAAALVLYRDWLPRRDFKWMRKQLKRIRRAAGQARDCDVLIERLKSTPADSARRRWLAAVTIERAEAQRAIVAVHDRLIRSSRFEEHIDRLLDAVRRAGRAQSGTPSARFGQWARQTLRPIVDAFFAALPTADPTDELALHQVRIRGKKLRYAMESLAGAFPDPFRTTLYPVLEALQDRLGTINDLVTARTRLEKQIDRAHGRHGRGRKRLLGEVEARLVRARHDFAAWCTPELVGELRDGFAALLVEPEADRPSADHSDLDRLAS